MTTNRKVFGLGLTRTGTTSLCVALNKLGISAKHYPHDRTTYKELTSGIYRLSVMEHFDAATDISVAPFYPQLDATYPGSRFILTTRDVDSWLQAMESHFVELETLEDMSEPFRQFMDFICPAVYGTLRFSADRFRYVYERHVAEVRAYFRDRPGDLLELDILGGEGWEKLCEFLGVPVPEEPFPHFHQAAEQT
jgi:hypothetical protein